MHIWSRKISRVLADKSGMETSVAELMVSTIVKVAVTGSLAAIIGGVTMFSAMANASTQNSSAYQTSDLQFAKAVHAAERVIGYDDGAVALLSKSGAACSIDIWHGVKDAGASTLTLHEERRAAATSSPASP
jgi:dihydroorotase-like cyclic amidohydrolase